MGQMLKVNSEELKSDIYRLGVEVDRDRIKDIRESFKEKLCLL
jgi:hypothetical protein